VQNYIIFGKISIFLNKIQGKYRKNAQKVVFSRKFEDLFLLTRSKSRKFLKKRLKKNPKIAHSGLFGKKATLR
jgi:hypothetical protein